MANTIRLLHTEDDGPFAELVETFLHRELADITVHHAMNPAEGVEILAESPIDCIVSDYDMPEINGIEFLEAVRDDYPELPFILFTGKGSEEVASEAISKGVTDYLQKGSGTDQYALLANRVKNAVERTKADQRAEEAQARYQTLIDDVLETSDIGTFILDANFEIVWINSAVEKYFGITRDDVIEADKRELIESEIADKFEDPERFKNRVTATYDDNTYVEEFSCHILPGEDRRERWLKHWSQPIESGLFQGGRIEHYTDITERKARKQELRRTERRFEAVLEDPNILAGVLDTDGRLLEANQTAMKYVDADIEDVLGEFFWETPWWSEDLQPAVRDHVEQAAQGQYVSYEADLETPDDEPYSVEGVIRPVTDDSGTVVSLIVSARDITDRAVRQQRLETILENTENPLFMKDREGRYLLVNEGYKRVFGLEETEVIGRTDAEIFPPEMADEVWANDRQVLEWAGNHSIYRLNSELPPAEPRFDWECSVCSYRERCGKGNREFADIKPDGLLQLFVYPIEKLTEYLETHGGKLTPTLAHHYPELTGDYDVYDWQCRGCESTFSVNSIEWSGNVSSPPKCPTCADDGSIRFLAGPSPSEQSRGVHHGD